MTLLFDLDGTLLDSTDLLLAGYKHAVRHHLARETSSEEWLPHFGQPLRQQMALFSEEHADEMTTTYRRFYAQNHDVMLRLYPGVGEVIAGLHAAGHTLAVVTSKLTAFAVRGLQLFGLLAFFDTVIGENEVSKHKPDPAAVLLALDRLNAKPSDAWMIGDSPADMQAGRAAGCRTAAALWGPFSRESLAPYNPTAYLEYPVDLLHLPY